MQILDALLRIEELLQQQNDRHYGVEGEVEDVIVNVKPQATPFQKAVAAKPKGARGAPRVDRL